MSMGHTSDAGGYLEYGEASVLLPVEDLNATVLTHRDAERALENASAETVLAVKPTGLASSYALTQRPLTAIVVASLGDELRERIEEAADADLANFEYIQVGRVTTPAQNRSLAEF
jgi:hypothetical protein